MCIYIVYLVSRSQDMFGITRIYLWTRAGRIMVPSRKQFCCLFSTYRAGWPCHLWWKPETRFDLDNLPLMRLAMKNKTFMFPFQ